MRSEAKDRAYLWDMLDAAQAINEFVAGKTFDDYASDRMLRGAVERHLEIIGETARNVSESFQQAHPEFPWKPMVGQRNVLAHEYGEIRHDRVWSVCKKHIPELVVLLKSVGIDTD